MTTFTRHSGITATAGTGPKLSTIRNLCENPRAVNSTGIAGAAGTGGLVTLTRPTAGGPLPEAPSFARLTWTTAPTANNGQQLYNGVAGKNLVTPGKTYVVRAYVRASFAAQISPKAGFYTGASYLSGSTGATVSIAANTWTPISFEFTAPAGSDRAQLNTDLTGTTLPVVGSTLDATAWFLFEKPATGSVDTTPYGDGDAAGWAWLGTAHASASEGYGAIV